MRNPLKLLIIVALLTVIACNKKKDAVDDLTPVERWTPEQLHILNTVCTKPNGEQKTYLKQAWPNMQNDVSIRMRANHYITDSTHVDSVKIGCGSCENAKALDSAGVWHDNLSFENRAVFFIYHDGEAKPKTVLLACGNGMMSDCSVQPSFSMDAPMAFRIKTGEGLCNYVGMKEALMIKERFGLKLTRGRGCNGKEVSANDAKSINTDSTQLTVLVHPGDSINLNTWEYIPANR